MTYVFVDPINILTAYPHALSISSRYMTELNETVNFTLLFVITFVAPTRQPIGTLRTFPISTEFPIRFIISSMRHYGNQSVNQ